MSFMCHYDASTGAKEKAEGLTFAGFIYIFCHKTVAVYKEDFYAIYVFSNVALNVMFYQPSNEKALNRQALDLKCSNSK